MSQRTRGKFWNDKEHFIYREFGLLLLNLNKHFIPKSEEDKQEFLHSMETFYDFMYLQLEDLKEYTGLDWNIHNMEQENLLYNAEKLLNS